MDQASAYTDFKWGIDPAYKWGRLIFGAWLIHGEIRYVVLTSVLVVEVCFTDQHHAHFEGQYAHPARPPTATYINS